MKVFVDECVTEKLMPHLIGHSFVHVNTTAYRGLRNGELLRRLPNDCDVFLTTDRHIKHQQNLPHFPFAFVVMRGVSNAIDDLLPLLPDTLAALDSLAKAPIMSGDLHEVFPP